jgi:carnitine 3-dehydrogenase
MWREALHMVANGEATVEQLDLAITAGPGLRWALMGPMLTFHLAGGEGGMAHMLDHFGPSLKSPWTRLEAPELTRELRDAVVEGCEDEANGRSVAALVNERDKGLIAIIKALRAAGVGTPGDGGLHGA